VKRCPEIHGAALHPSHAVGIRIPYVVLPSPEASFVKPSRS